MEATPFSPDVFENKVKLQQSILSWADKLKRRTAEPGDILYVDRDIYRHYGICSDKKDQIIHYTNGIIQETPFEKFLLDSETCYLCLPELNLLLSVGEDLYEKDLRDEFITKLFADPDFHIYSAAETLTRAKSRLGEKDYRLADNNCEHFALWAKTGLSNSSQVMLHPYIADFVSLFMYLTKNNI